MVKRRRTLVSEEERQKWDRRYAEGEYRPRTWPAPFLETWIDRLPAGRALDVACGIGRNALRLAEAGYQVEAVDISASAVAMARAEADGRGLEVEWRVVDLDDANLARSCYDVITVIRYVNRRLWPQLIAALAPGGWLLVEHHLQTTADVSGPGSPEFRLAPQELLEAFNSLRIIYYQEEFEPAEADRKGYALARMVACRGNPGF
jgi:SAM-dependent methyltransferase